MDELDNALDAPPKTTPLPGTDQKTYGDPVVQGPLLQKQGPDLSKHLYGLWKAQNLRYERRLAEWRVNERRRNGEYGLFVTKRENIGQLDVYRSPGMDKTPTPVYNKADRLCHRATAFQFADDYQPYVEPSEDTDEDKDSAEIGQRALEDVTSDSHLNLGELVRQAFDRGHTGGSGYILVYPDPYAGGRHPMQVEAGDGATTVDDATEDPLTGMPRANLTLRYVKEDGSLTDNKEEAALQWRPELDGNVYASRHIRFTPWDASDIWDADGVVIAEYRPFGQLKRLYKELADLDEGEIRSLAEHRPEGWRELLPWKDGKPWDPGQPDDVPSDDLIVAHIRYWGTECGEYPDGVCVAVVGKDTVTKQEPWVGKQGGRFKLELPVVQVKQWRKAGDPHGHGTMDILGDASESRAAIMGMFYDYCEKIGDRKVFIPSNSTLNGQDYAMDSLTYIPINAGGEPKYEDIPPMPKEITETFLQLTSEMDDAVSLSQTAQNLDTNPNQSGRAKLAIISQVQASLSDQKRFVHNAYVRAWRICLQLMREYYTKPQQLQWAGEHGGYKFKRWSGSDLAGVKDVKVRPGTGTMLTPMQKIEQALMLQQSGVVQLPEVLDTLGHDVAAITGIKDNIHLQRVRRQIAEWEQGPPEGSEPIPEQPQMQPVLDALGMPVVDPVTGQPAQQPAMGPQGPLMFQPPNPAAMAIFRPLLVDSQMDVAPIRARELGKAMAGVTYLSFPPDWQEALNQAYSQSVMAMSPPPPPPGGPAPEVEQEDEGPKLTDGEQAMAGKSPDPMQNA